MYLHKLKRTDCFVPRSDGSNIVFSFSEKSPRGFCGIFSTTVEISIVL